MVVDTFCMTNYDCYLRGCVATFLWCDEKQFTTANDHVDLHIYE